MVSASVQVGNSGGEKKNHNEKGFTQVPNELIEFFANPPFRISERENRIIWFLIRELTGYHAKFKPITIDQFTQGTEIPKQNLIPAIKDLIQKNVLTRKRISGLRTWIYGFNEELLTRTVVGEPIQTCQAGSKVVDLMHFKVTKVMTSKVVKSDIFKNRRAALVAATQPSKYNQIKRNKSLHREIQAFIESRPRATKGRWERFILETLEANPDDQDILSLAIQRVETTKKDFFGKPILASSIGLFEKSEWRSIKTAFLAILQKEKEEQDKEAKRKENEELVRAAKIREESGIDINNISPIFQRYAHMKGTI